MIASKDQKVIVNKIFEMMEDILRYLEDEEDEDYETNQVLIGMQHLFRRYVIKAWKGSNFNHTKYYSLNKILVKHYVLYYTKCWKHRNEIYYGRDEQRRRAIKWKEDI